MKKNLCLEQPMKRDLSLEQPMKLDKESNKLFLEARKKLGSGTLIVSALRQIFASGLEDASLGPRRTRVERWSTQEMDAHNKNIEELDIVLGTCLETVEGLKRERERAMEEMEEELGRTVS